MLERLHERACTPQLIMTGLKIYTIKLDGQHQRTLIFKDTLNYFASSLASLYSTFELQQEPGVENKPFFPYMFIKTQNLNRVLLHLPPKHCYCPSAMKSKERAAFEHWYAEHRNERFVLREQLVAYCRNDVALLRAACIKFREQLRAVTTRVEPFIHASTLAKLTMDVFRAEFLRPNMLVNLPEQGINSRGQQSYVALRFFRLFERLFPGLQVRTAEWTIGEEFAASGDANVGYRIDGVVKFPTRIPIAHSIRRLALEFNGCYYHGKQIFFN